jgi:ABC-type polysaccharide transport system permease subunit
MSVQNEVMRRKREISFKKFAKYWQFYLIILLPLLYLILFSYVPMYGVVLAFKKFSFTKGIMGSPWIGFKLFSQFFSSPSSVKIIMNTVFISIYSIAAGFPIPILLAVALNEVRGKLFKKTVQMVTYAPYFISTVVMVGLILQVTDPRNGIINQFITLFGGEAVNFLGKSEYFASVYVWSGIWQGAGYSAVIYLAALAGVSRELQEAAVIDGASRFKRIVHVDLPSIRPTIVILFLFSIGSIMNVGFEKIFLMQNTLNISASEVIATFVYKVGLLSADYSFSTAVGLFNSVVNLFLLILANSVARKVDETSLW